ncbi:MAG TPA: MFS transporter [Candidatus Limiplasma sp.]|nr:MFS transporter [Candidatus Limiplasma sp.]
MRSFFSHRGFGIIIRCMMIQGAIIGIALNCIGVFMVAICADKGFSTGAFSAYATLRILSGSLLMPFLSPVIFGRFGKYNRYVNMLFGGMVFAGMILSTLFNSIIWWYVLGILTGVCYTFFSINQAMVISNWFHHKYALALGLVGTMSGLAGAVFSPIASWMILRFGWQTAMIVISLIGLALVVLGGKGVYLKPEEVGAQPYTNPIGSDGQDPAPAVKDIRYTKPAGRMLFGFLLLVMVCNLTLANCVLHLPNYAHEVGYNLEIAALFTSFAMLGNVGGKLAFGMLCDHFDCRKITVLSFVAIGLALVLIANKSLGLIPMLICSFFIGTSQSAQFVLMPTLSRELYGQISYAKNYPKLFSIGALLSAPLFTLAGVSSDATGSYRTGMAVMVAFYAVSIVVLLCAYGIHRRGIKQTA